MTEKLKTLKDIFDGNDKCCANCTEKEVREAAIEWIKELEFRMSYQEHEHNEHKALLHSIDWIKHFFNITEEDLT